MASGISDQSSYLLVSRVGPRPRHMSHYTRASPKTGSTPKQLTVAGGVSDKCSFGYYPVRKAETSIAKWYRNRSAQTEKKKGDRVSSN